MDLHITLNTLTRSYILVPWSHVHTPRRPPAFPDRMLEARIEEQEGEGGTGSMEDDAAYLMRYARAQAKAVQKSGEGMDTRTIRKHACVLYR
jgi:hypothetical protein